MKALIFDVDGTLADTERYGHLPACNAAFAALDLSIEWTWETFKDLMERIPGNAPRLRWWLNTHTEMRPEEIAQQVERFAPLKQRLYIEEYLPRLPLRPGVTRIIEQAVSRGLGLAIVSTSYEQQIHALLATHLAAFYPYFEPVLGKESGLKTGEDGRLYEQCLAQLGLDPHEVLVIEDSESGFQAARRAGLPCAVIYNDYTFGQNFSGAELAARSLEFFDLEQLLNLCSAEVAVPL